MKMTTSFRGRAILLCLLFFALTTAGCSSEEEVLSPNELSQSKAEEKETSSTDISTEIGEVSSYDESEEIDASENMPPEITSLKLSPIPVYAGTVVKANVEAVDEEGDFVTFYYRWKKNDEFIPDAETEELDTSTFKKGDIITAFVTPYDEERKGKERMSPSLLISNRPPEITSAPIGKVENGVFIYNVKANDADGDALQFSLEQFPEGMTIDSETGKIAWKMPEEEKGTARVKVVVSDGDAQAFQGFGLSFGK